MRMFAQDRALYRKLRVDGTDDPEALRRLRIVEGVDLMRERFTAAQAVGAFGVSRATYCEWSRRLGEGGVKALVSRSSRPRTHRGRRWTKADVWRVLRLRREMPWAGKARIAPLLAERWPDRTRMVACWCRAAAWRRWRRWSRRHLRRCRGCCGRRSSATAAPRPQPCGAGCICGWRRRSRTGAWRRGCRRWRSLNSCLHRDEEGT